MKVFDQDLMDRVPLESKYGSIVIVLEDGTEFLVTENEFTKALDVQVIRGGKKIVVMPHVANHIGLRAV